MSLIELILALCRPPRRPRPRPRGTAAALAARLYRLPATVLILSAPPPPALDLRVLYEVVECGSGRVAGYVDRIGAVGRYARRRDPVPLLVRQRVDGQVVGRWIVWVDSFGAVRSGRLAAPSQGSR